MQNVTDVSLFVGLEVCIRISVSHSKGTCPSIFQLVRCICGGSRPFDVGAKLLETLQLVV